MYISKLIIQNFRCFGSQTIEFQPGVSVIVGENNAGKSAVLAALGQVLNQSSRRRPGPYDFFRGITDFDNPPSITIQVVLSSSAKDTLSDKALVSAWLTKIEDPWEAMLTYRFFLPDSEHGKFKEDLLKGQLTEAHFFQTLVDHLPKFVGRIYGGNPDDALPADSDALARFQFQFVDAMRDVKSSLFAGSDPLLKTMLKMILAPDKWSGEPPEPAFPKLAKGMQDHMTARLDLSTLFSLLPETGAGDSGSLALGGQVQEDDILAALRLSIEKHGMSLPLIHDGLGYNNLVYISLLLAKMDLECKTEHSGENAILFPLLAVEEPEAHLHPALQYRLLKFLKKRVEDSAKSRQVIITTHSTQITSASGLDNIICLTAPSSKAASPGIAYPGRVFGSDTESQKSKKYVERYLDATKSNLLFAKSIILVEGLAELLVLPVLADYAGTSFESSHTAIVSVGGSNFKHFLPLFGCGTETLRCFALPRRVACVVDADPSKLADKPKARWKSCWPNEQDYPEPGFQYRPVSGVVTNLLAQKNGVVNVDIYVGTKTFEFDLALANPISSLLFTDACEDADVFRAYAQDQAAGLQAYNELIKDTSAEATLLAKLPADLAHDAVRFATRYLLATEASKGAHALALSLELRANFGLAAPLPLAIPAHLVEALRFVSVQPA